MRKTKTPYTLWRWPLVATGAALLYAAVAAWLTPHFVDLNPVGIAFPTRVAEGSHTEWQLLPWLWGLVIILAVCCWQFSKEVTDRSRAFHLLGGQTLVLFALMFVTVTLSGDVYAYVVYGHLYGVYGVNPYLLGSRLPDYGDPLLNRLLQFFGNPPPGDNYGPLWTLMAGAVGRLESGASLAVHVWTYRAIAVMGAIAATIGILWALRREPARDRFRKTSLFAMHPLLLYESAVGAHNDVLMIAAAIWSFALVDELPLIAGILLGASIALKYVSLVLLPFLAIRALKQGISNAVICVLIAVGLPLLFFRPFWVGWETLTSLIGHAGTLDMSPLWLVSLPFFLTGTANTPAFPGALMSWPRIFELAAIAIVIGLIGVATLRYAKTFNTGYIWRAVLALLMSLPIIHPWYVQWILPAVACETKWAVYAWWLGLLIFLRYALEGIAPATAGPLLTPTLITLTLAYLVIPVIVSAKSQMKSVGG